MLILAVPPLALLLMSSTPAIELEENVAVIGIATPVKVRATDSHGLLSLDASLVQNGQRNSIYHMANLSHRLFFLKGEAPHEYAFMAGTKAAPALKDGKATLEIEAISNDFRASHSLLTRDVTVITLPPAVDAVGLKHSMKQGGSELVLYTASANAAESGVKIGNHRFRGYPAPGRTQRFALFSFPWDVATTEPALVYARNAAEEVTKEFGADVIPDKFRKRALNIDDAFLERVVPQIDPGGSGDLLARFLKINREIRKQNNQTLADLRLKTENRFLWNGPFIHLKAAVESEFADARSYIYKGKKVDEQIHLGYDLANFKNSPIQAANDGKVIFAQNLGIYGNCVVIDHGYSLQTIYGHMSRIDVHVGDPVRKGQRIGLTGSTGMAGGDHLHFSMQIEGVQVNPLEWWDAHWIHDRILGKLAPQ